ncbi:unnamed protein product [Vicia faba]|uniref:Uncharacterized protein n=1 Tax=Vicia faba TaxID=3906 RepID=A0AAV0ZTV5_VICFA|nr:unnamed protein product [Vicia faba]
MWNLVNNMQSNIINKGGMVVADQEMLEIDDAKRKIVHPGDIFKRGITMQTSTNIVFKKKEKDAIDLQMMADLDVELMHTNGTTSATSPTLAVADEFDIAEDIEESDNEVDDGSDDDDDGGGDGGGDENNEDDNVEIMGDDPSKWRISDLI